MIISKLKGGLGNQLFQYAIGRSYAYNSGTELKLDIDYLYNKVDKTATPRSYRLFCFNINSSIAEEVDKKNVLGCSFLQIIKRRLWKSGLDLCKWNYFKEKEYGYHPEFIKEYKSFYLDGYWQSPLYFNSIRKDLLNELVIQSKFITTQFRNLRDEIQSNLSVAIHVRRGDYVSNSLVTQEFGICTLEYYLRAIKHIQNKLASDLFFYIFSDDIEWCKEQFSELQNIKFVTGFEDYQDLILISTCKHQIIANSTFSWWGAWLNQNVDKIVIAPLIWYVDTKFDTSTLIPAEWIRL